MKYDLITLDDYASLPSDPKQCFVFVENTVRGNMNRLMAENENNHTFNRSLKMEYMALVAGAAGASGLTNITAPEVTEEDEDFERSYRAFKYTVTRVVAEIGFQARLDQGKISVQITGSNKSKIIHYLLKLRESVIQSDLSDDKKTNLLERIKSFEKELIENPRLDLARAAVFAAAILTGVAQLTTIAADGPNAIVNIFRLIGEDAESESAAILRLMPPVKALPSPEKDPKSSRSDTASKRASQPRSKGPDDEIPF